MKREKVKIDSKFPIYTIEDSMIISKQADITIGFEILLPELYTLSKEEYSNIHSYWNRAVKVLPNYSIVHKQDYFVEKQYESSYRSDDFFDHSYNEHFKGRRYMEHKSYLFITKTTKKRFEGKSNFNSLTRSQLLPLELTKDNVYNSFLDLVSQFESILNDSQLIKLRRLEEDESIKLIEYYLSLDIENLSSADITFNDDHIRVGSEYLSLHTLSNTDKLPMLVKETRKHETMSTDNSNTYLSYASNLGVLLDRNHIYNQYLFIGDSDVFKKDLESKSKLMLAFGGLSRKNYINREWIEDYISTSISEGLAIIKGHFNVFSFTDKEHEIKSLRNDVGTAIASMDCKPHLNSIDLATLYWSGIPGNSADFPMEESFFTFSEIGLCFFNQESSYRSIDSDFGIRLSDRQSGKPVFIDISDEPMRRGITTNRNKFVLGPSGSGKSFFVNHLLRQYYEQGTHIVMIDTGHSYEGLCRMINKKTKGEDGIYITYRDDKPISFNPFYTDDYVFDIEKRTSIGTLIFTLWKGDKEPSQREFGEVMTSIQRYIEKIQSNRSIEPSFNTYYDYLRDDYSLILSNKKEQGELEDKDFDLKGMLRTLDIYYKGGIYDFLLNSKENIDLLKKRFVVFEIDSIKDDKILFPIVTIVIMEAFINKMRRLKGIRKMILIEEAWKAIASANMAEYIKYLYKTVRKFNGEAVVVTQEVDDIINSPIVKESIINNSDCKILLDQRKYMNKFNDIQNLLGLSEKEKGQVLSINLNNDPKRKYKEVFISLGGVDSKVYATEVSLEEYLAFTTEEREKVELLELSEEKGDYESAIIELANKKRVKNSNK